MLLVLSLLLLAPLCTPMTLRPPRTLPYFDYPEEFDYEMENDISRTLPKRKPLNPFNSPIYYIRLPPQPYMFVPGLGYVSQPPQPPQMSEFVPVPVDFVANGKPSTIYQWAAGGGFQKPEKPQKKPQTGSEVHKLEGQFNFNGKPENVFLLRDSYNALYGDALQNFYP